MDKSNRIPFKSFRIALDLCDNNTAKTSNGNVIDAVADNVSDSSSDAMFQVECVLANMIDKGYMKGYLSHEHQIAVLSNKEAFPALHNVKY